MKLLLRFTLILLSTFFFQSISFSQTNTWTGGTGDWNVVANWDMGIPTTSHDVRISAGDVVTIPAAFAAVAKSVSMNTGGSLTIAATGSLAINGSTESGLILGNASSMFENNGTLTIGNSSHVANNGILIVIGAATNNGIIEVDDVTFNGIELRNSSTFINSSTGMVKIGITTAVAANGVAVTNTSAFTNNGTLLIDNITSLDGIAMLNGSTINNTGTIKIGTNSPIGRIGIVLFHTCTFSNTTSGVVEVNRTALSGFHLVGSSNFTNFGTIHFGNISGSGSRGIGGFEMSSFDNKSGATIKITGSAVGVQMETAASATNSGSMEINGTGFDGIWLVGNSTFQNNNILKIGNLSANPEAAMFIQDAAAFTNATGSTLDIDNVPVSGGAYGAIALYFASASFSNAGTFNIGLSTAVSHGIGNKDGAGGIFTNTGTINVGNTSGNGIVANQAVTNSAGGQISIPSGQSFTNKGTLTNNGMIKGNGTLV